MSMNLNIRTLPQIQLNRGVRIQLNRGVRLWLLRLVPAFTEGLGNKSSM